MTTHSFAKDNTAYERWLRRQCKVVEAALKAKHDRMRESAFDFLRATFFRWGRTIEAVCPEAATAPTVLSVGDLHVENFGTWRDAQARLVWGVNDFDEAAAIPYTFDLIRLTVSAQLAPTLSLKADAAAEAILDGYRRGLSAPRPTLLDEHENWLRHLFAPGPKGYESFWDQIEDCADTSPPRAVREALRQSLPEGARVLRFATRTKGGGSLGRPRYLAIAEWAGGRLIREAKATVPSAWDWAHGAEGHTKSRLIKVSHGAYRSPEPGLAIASGFAIRRVAADSRKLDLADAAKQGLGARLLKAMAADLGAIHAADKRCPKVLDDLKRREPDWLRRAARDARRAVQADFESLAG